MTTTLGGTIERCRRAARLSGGSICVGVSGGKDSLATLDVIARSGAFARIEVFAMYLVSGLEVFERPVRAAAARYGVPVHFVPHWDLARMLKFAVLRPHVHASQDLRLLRLRDVELALTKRTSIPWFAYGERAADSIVRRIYTRDCDGVQEQWKRLWPIWPWKKAEVLAYLRNRRIPVPAPLGGGRFAGGIDLTNAATLAHIKKHHPHDYRKIQSVFTWADIAVFRYERGDFETFPGAKQEKAKSPGG